MSDIQQIENHSTFALKIYFSVFDNAQIIPGINFVSSSIVEKLQQHPQFKDYIERGILSFVAKPDFKIDERTNLAYIQEKEELVPVQNAIINNRMTPLASNGRIFKLNDLIDAGVSSLVSQNMIKFAPSEGWRDAEHIISALEIDEQSKDAPKISKLFE